MIALFILLTGINLIASTILLVEVITGFALEPLFFTPSNLYENTHMNEIGCYTCCVLVCTFCSLYAFIMFFYWLFHLGRD